MVMVTRRFSHGWSRYVHALILHKRRWYDTYSTS